MDHVKVRNVKGKERLFSLQVWNLMRTPKETGDTRKGWTVIERVNGAAPTPAPGAKAQPGGPQPTFQPEELKAKEEAAFKAEAERATGMISGEATAPAPEPVAAEAAAPAAEAPKADPAETATPAPENEAAPAAPPAKKDNLAQIQGTGEKVVAILNGIGIHTFAQLAGASIGAVNKALDEGGMGPKKAMVPTWKMKAAELAKA